MSRIALVALVGLGVGCQPRPLPDHALVGAWAFEDAVPMFDNGSSDSCQILADSRLTLDADHRMLWAIHLDYGSVEEGATCPIEVVDTTVYQGDWLAFHYNDEDWLGIEVDRRSEQEVEKDPDGPQTLTYAVDSLASEAFELQVASGEDDNGRWLYVGGWGLHREAE